MPLLALARRVRGDIAPHPCRPGIPRETPLNLPLERGGKGLRAPFDSRKGRGSKWSYKAAPPSTVIMEPVTPLASSDAAKRKALAKSSGIISRPIGVLERLPS